MKHYITRAPKIKKTHALQWIFDSLSDRDDFIEKRMFGCLAGYLGDRIILVIADKETPWNGILVPTEREHHESIRKKFPMLKPHPVLGKWLYLDQSSENFEETIGSILEAIQKADPRFGVIPRARKRKR